MEATTCSPPNTFSAFWQRTNARSRPDASTRRPAFARLVDSWEVHLSPMAAAYAEVEPPATVKAGHRSPAVRLHRRVHDGRRPRPASGPASPSGAALPPRRSQRWRSISPCPTSARRSSSRRSASSPRWPPMAAMSNISSSTTPRTHDVGLSHVSGERAAGKDFELWMIEGKNAPVSMGVIPAGADHASHGVAGRAAEAGARRRARRQRRADGRFADRPADRTGRCRGRSEGHLIGLRS